MSHIEGSTHIGGLRILRPNIHFDIDPLASWYVYYEPNTPGRLLELLRPNPGRHRQLARPTKSGDAVDPPLYYH